MFLRIPVFLVVAAAASARMDRRIHAHRDTATPECNSGNVQCCNSVSKATELAPVLTELGYVYDPADSVGVDCTPFNLYGFGEGAGCQAQPVCCSNNTYSGEFNVGCSPLDFN